MNWYLLNNIRVFRLCRRALAASPLSLGLNPDGTNNPITQSLGDASGALLR